MLTLPSRKELIASGKLILDDSVENEKASRNPSNQMLWAISQMSNVGSLSNLANFSRIPSLGNLSDYTTDATTSATATSEEENESSDQSGLSSDDLSNTERFFREGAKLLSAKKKKKSNNLSPSAMDDMFLSPRIVSKYFRRLRALNSSVSNENKGSMNESEAIILLNKVTKTLRRLQSLGIENEVLEGSEDFSEIAVLQKGYHQWRRRSASINAEDDDLADDEDEDDEEDDMFAMDKIDENTPSF